MRNDFLGYEWNALGPDGLLYRISVAVFELAPERAQVLDLSFRSTLYERREGFLEWGDDSFKFVVLLQIAQETGKITVTRDDQGFAIAIVINHRLEDELGIDVSLHLTLLGGKDLLEDDDESRLLQDEIEILIVEHKPEKYVGDIDIALLGEVGTEFLPVDLPAETVESRIEILGVDKGIIGFCGFFFHGFLREVIQGTSFVHFTQSERESKFIPWLPRFFAKI